MVPGNRPSLPRPYLGTAAGRRVIAPVPATVTTAGTPTATPAKAAKADAATHKQAAPDWQVDLKSASLTDAGLVLEDQSVTPSAKLRADAIKLTLGSISTRMQDPVTLDLQARLNQSGNLSVSGSLMPQTKAAELTLDGRNLYSLERLRALGFSYYSVGRPSIVQPVG